MTRTQPTQASRRTTHPRISQSLLIMLSILIRRGNLSHVTNIKNHTQGRFSPQRKPIITMFTTFIRQNITIRPSMNLTIKDLLNSSLHTITRMFRSRMINLHIRPQAHNTTSIRHHTIKTSLQVVSTTTFNRIRTLRSTPEDMRRCILTMSGPIKRQNHRHDQEIRQQLLRHNSHATNQMTTMTNHGSNHTRNTRHRRSNLVSHNSHLIKETPLRHSSNINKANHNSRLRQLPSNGFRVLLIRFRQHSLRQPIIQKTSNTHYNQGSNRRRRDRMFFRAIHYFRRFVFSSAASARGIPFEHIRPPPPMIVMLFTIVHALTRAQ